MALPDDKIRKIEEEFNGDDLLQYERKRWGLFGIPFTFTKYYLTNKRIIKKSGLINFTEDEILLYRILDVRISRTFWQRIFKIGSLDLITSDKTDPKLTIANIKNVRVFKNKLSEYVEKERLRVRFRAGEFVDSGDNPNDNDDY